MPGPELLAHVTPWSWDERGPCVWGVPVDPAWWRAGVLAGAARKDELQTLAEYRDDLGGGPGALACLVAGAVEQVSSWQQLGVPVAGRRWVDIGGATGHYALALHLAGARHTSLLDREPPGLWAAPVLSAAGVDVLVGDATASGVASADAALLLYVPVDRLAVLEQSPGLRLVVVDRLTPRERAALEQGGWQIEILVFPRGTIAMGQSAAVPGLEGEGDPEELLLCRR